MPYPGARPGCRLEIRSVGREAPDGQEYLGKLAVIR
jgi:hypothetical protein